MRARAAAADAAAPLRRSETCSGVVCTRAVHIIRASNRAALTKTTPHAYVPAARPGSRLHSAAATSSSSSGFVRAIRGGGAAAARADAAAASDPGAGAAANAAAAAAASQQQGPKRPTHLVVMVNGLSGAASNWRFLAEQLRRRLPPEIAADALLHASAANERLATWAGVDRCGQRLADEVRGLVAAHPHLERISIVAHSMGGLISRYAVGALFNPATRRVAGLVPAHFVTLATPHCGCDTDGVSAVPFVRWAGDLPLLGPAVYGLLSSVAHATGALLLARTGEQFFLLDGGGGSGGGGGGGTLSDGPLDAAAADPAAARPAFGVGAADEPLLVQMTRDVPEKGLFFFSALAAFRTRTCYANTDGARCGGAVVAGGGVVGPLCLCRLSPSFSCRPALFQLADLLSTIHNYTIAHRRPPRRLGQQLAAAAPRAAAAAERAPARRARRRARRPAVGGVAARRLGARAARGDRW